MCHNGSGEFVIAFSVATKIPDSPMHVFLSERRLNDTHSLINTVFQATIEAVEESILSALCAAKSTVGRGGNRSVKLPIGKALSILNQHLG